MGIVKNSKYSNSFTIEEMTQGKILALWHPLEDKRESGGLTPVEYDCWLQLNRFVEEYMPKLVKVHK